MVAHNCHKQRTYTFGRDHGQHRKSYSSWKQASILRKQINKNLMWEQPSEAFPENKRFSKIFRIYEKWNWVSATNLSPSNFTRIKNPSQVTSKNYAEILIYLSVYISLLSGIVASNISNKSQGINLKLKQFLPNVPFFGFLMFLGVRERVHWEQMA